MKSIIKPYNDLTIRSFKKGELVIGDNVYLVIDLDKELKLLCLYSDDKDIIGNIYDTVEDPYKIFKKFEGILELSNDWI